MSINLEVLRKRWEEIESNLCLLEQAAQLALSDFISIPDKVEASMFRLIVSIEAAQAVCSHLSARASTRTPDSPAACFACLADAGLYSAELGVNLGAMTRFRNLLVHRYWNIDAAQVHGFLADGIRDLRQFNQATMRYARVDHA